MNYNPYYLAMTQMGNPKPQVQDIGGLSPVFQNIAAQQANQNAVMQQGQALTQAAGQTGQQSGGMNPMAMAQMLRKGKPDQAGVNAKDAQMGGLGTYNPMTQYDISQQYGTNMYSPQSKMLAAQESGMGFNSPVSNMPVVGAYGQLLPNN